MREPDALADRARVENNLREAMIRSLQTHPQLAGDWQVDADHVGASNFAAPEDKPVTFTVSLSANRTENGVVKESVGGSQGSVTVEAASMIEGVGAIADERHDTKRVTAARGGLGAHSKITNSAVHGSARMQRTDVAVFRYL